MSEPADKPWFVWLSDEYSVPREQVCYASAPSPNADFKCIRAAGHDGKHTYSHGVCARDYSHKDPRSAGGGA